MCLDRKQLPTASIGSKAQLQGSSAEVHHRQHPVPITSAAELRRPSANNGEADISSASSSSSLTNGITAMRNGVTLLPKTDGHVPHLICEFFSSSCCSSSSFLFCHALLHLQNPKLDLPYRGLCLPFFSLQVRCIAPRLGIEFVLEKKGFSFSAQALTKGEGAELGGRPHFSPSQPPPLHHHQNSSSSTFTCKSKKPHPRPHTP